MIEKDYLYLGKVFLELIAEDSKFKASFQSLAPEIYADIESASTNPNCSCRAKVENYIIKNRDKSYVFLIEYIKQNNPIIDLQAIEEKYKRTHYSGKIEQIKISEWSQYSEKLMKDKAVFRGFSVVKLNEEFVEVYFL